MIVLFKEVLVVPHVHSMHSLIKNIQAQIPCSYSVQQDVFVTVYTVQTLSNEKIYIPQ